VLGALACAAPTLLAWNVAPSATFLNQALAFALWGWFVFASATLAGPPLPALRAARDAVLALALCIAATLWSWGPGALPTSLALSLIGALLAGGLVLWHGAAIGGEFTAGRAAARRAFGAFCTGWLAAGLAGSAIAAIQVFAPSLADGQWIAASGIAGRAVGNLRQPNHLSSVLLWACVALIALHEFRRWPLAASAALGAVLVVAVVLTASRTGLLSVLLLAAWGALDRRLARTSRALLLAAPLVYAAAWWGLAWWSDAAGQRFGGAARLAETDISGSRFGIWADTWALVREHPWFGVGVGEFNLAWSLTPFPGRPTAFFDHAHNLPLHLAAELGLPLATLVLGLLVAAALRVLRAAWREADGHAGTMLRCSFVMVAMIALHSLLEYPLWYAYFLLPALWVFGLALGLARPAVGAAPAAARSPLLAFGGAMLVACTALALLDYRRVVVIFAAPEGAPPLAQRIAEGRHSLLFEHHAAYAEATTAGPESAHLEPFSVAAHYLLDTRLMMAWADALHRAGRVDEARHVAARLREFRNPASQEYFEVCELPATVAPYNCQPPLRAYGWRDFTR
jgi:O-antigen ligase